MRKEPLQFKEVGVCFVVFPLWCGFNVIGLHSSVNRIPLNIHHSILIEIHIDVGMCGLDISYISGMFLVMFKAYFYYSSVSILDRIVLI